MTPFAFWRFAAEAQAVAWRRSLALLAASPADQGVALLRMAEEKRRAVEAGAAAGLRMALRGGDAGEVLAASLGPARKRVRRNTRRHGLG